MAETFKRIAQRGVGTGRTRVGGYTVPGGATAIVIGSSFVNVTAATVAATVEHHDGTNYTALAKDVQLGAGQLLAPSGEVNKLVLQAGDGVFVTSSAAASLDCIISILEITS